MFNVRGIAACAPPQKKTHKKRLIEQSPFICEASIAAHDGIKCFFWQRSCLHWVEGRLCGTRNRTGIAPCLTFGSICHALVFVSWHRTPEIGQLPCALPQLQHAKALLHLSCLCLCWHRTLPEIGQLQRALSELLQIKALLHLSCLGLCWHRTQPEIGQFQRALSKLLPIKALLHLSGLGLCWHPTQPEIGTTSTCPFRAA